MKGMLSMCAGLLGGWIGWGIGARFGFTTGFIVSLIGSGLAVYFANRLSKHYLG
jgi:hypothetical protein